VLVSLWARWSEPSHNAAPEIARLAARYGAMLPIVRVDIEANPEIPAAFGITSVPAFVLVRRDAPPLGLIGFHSAGQIEQAFELSTLLIPHEEDSDTPVTEERRRSA
jgi:thioredoxin 1